MQYLYFAGVKQEQKQNRIKRSGRRARGLGMMARMPEQTSIVDPAGGDFGYWSEDAEGRPLFVYTMDHIRDPRAEYRTSLGPSRDHWHQVGTGSFVATVHNGGYTQIYDASRGGKLINRWSPGEGHFGGGFLLVEANGESYSTLWEGLPPGAEQVRAWGCNYAERRTRHAGLEVGERIDGTAADGALLFHWHARNLSPTPIDVVLVLPWWINLHMLTPVPLMTHGVRRWADRRRASLRRHYSVQVYHAGPDEAPHANSLLCTHTARRANPNRRDRPAMRDDFPPCIALVPLDGVAPEAAAWPLSAFARCPRTGLPLRLAPQAGATALTNCRADAGVALTLRYAFRLAPGEEAKATAYLDIEHAQDSPAQRRGERNWPSKGEVALEVPGHAGLARELRWHSAYLQGGTFFSEYHNACFVDQGSAYGYLQGLYGAPRDFALTILPMVYLNPQLAKDLLRHLLVAQHHRSGKLPYAGVGFGLQRGYGLHSFSSDLDLFLFWAMAEYLGATRDLAFLAEQLPFYPKAHGKHGTVLEHLRAAWRHLGRGVGLGPHGLYRSGTGDWNDVLLAFSRFPPLTILRGESALNAGLAALALPRLADALAGSDADFAEALRVRGAQQAEALRTMWCGDWAARGYPGYGRTRLGEDRLFLDMQAFGVLGGVWDTDQNARLFAAIDRDCAAPQRVGALALWPPMRGPLLEAGSDTNGGTWAAIDGLVAWAWAQHDPARAWAFYQGTTLAARAAAYPDVWYGVWSGPDAYNAHYHARPGETFLLNFTPMTDFPVMNMNRHAGPLLDAVKFAGIEPRGGAIEIRPRVPGGDFVFRSALFSLWGSATELRCDYRPVATGDFLFRVALPSGLVGKDARCISENQAVPVTLDEDGMLSFALPGQAGTPLTWCITSTQRGPTR